MPKKKKATTSKYSKTEFDKLEMQIADSYVENEKKIHAILNNHHQIIEVYKDKIQHKENLIKELREQNKLLKRLVEKYLDGDT